MVSQTLRFNSRSPSGLRRGTLLSLLLLHRVSIHAAQVGCDSTRASLSSLTSCFNSRSPSGLRRHNAPALPSGTTCFNSRSPSGLRQSMLPTPIRIQSVSIHAAQAGCDVSNTTIRKFWYSFNSRSPSGLRQNLHGLGLVGGCFNSRSPSGLRHSRAKSYDLAFKFQFTQPKRAAIFTKLQNGDQDVFLFTQPKQAATWACQKSR